ncbi:MAG: retropepsin-like domain-containing protein [Defluviitaleaceae bacterium]|nr:retropepsin-like domain-containing protein [Defluviitaleaceae bacterium]
MQQIMLKGITPLTLKAKLPLVTVTINGESKQFLLDNGAPALVLNSRYDNGGGTPLQAFTSAGEPQNIQSTFIALFEWEGIRLENELALIMDLSHYEEDTDTPIHGIMGYSAMMDRELLINYRDKKIGLLDIPENPPNLIEMIAPALIGKPRIFPIQMAHHFPLIPIRIGEHTLNMAINMGSCVNIIKKDYLEDFRLHGLLKDETPSVIRGLGTKKEAGAYPMKASLIGTAEEMYIDDMLFAFDDLEIPGMAVDGTLGYEFFKRAAVIIRFNRREMLVNI